MIEGFYDLQNEVMNCNFVGCPYRGSWDSEKLSEHSLSNKWCWWFKNKFPCGKDVYYILFRYTGELNGVIVALRPTGAWIIDTANIYLANALKRLGLVEERFAMEKDTFVYYDSRILVTDLIKCKGKAEEKIRDVPKPCLEFLKKELELVKKITGKEPVVIAMGGESERLLKKHRSALGIKNPIQRIPFHSYVYGRGRNEFGETAEERINKYAEEIKSAFSKAGLPIP
ncbi:MAG: hypothetical protein QW348_06855 [Ignisphaera sp.]